MYTVVRVGEPLAMVPFVFKLIGAARIVAWSCASEMPGDQFIVRDSEGDIVEAYAAEHVH